MDTATEGGALDKALFRKVMGSFASGVTVITTYAEGKPRGMTANAFMSGSLSPPLCIISVAKRAHMHACLQASKRFAVNILAIDQEQHSTHFAGRPIPGFWVDFRDEGGTPVLGGSVAHMTADTVAEHDCGDHTIFIGHIRAMSASGKAPLLYHAGHYGALGHLRRDDEVPVAEFW